MPDYTFHFSLADAYALCLKILCYKSIRGLVGECTESSGSENVLSTKKLDEAAIEATTEKFKTLITANGGEIKNVDVWGKRRLAYEIEDETEGYYYLVNFTSAPEFPAELDRIYKITDGVLRSIIVAK